jgi:hypothetical protein
MLTIEKSVKDILAIPLDEVVNVTENAAEFVSYAEHG